MKKSLLLLFCLALMLVYGAGLAQDTPNSLSFPQWNLVFTPPEGFEGMLGQLRARDQEEAALVWVPSTEEAEENALPLFRLIGVPEESALDAALSDLDGEAFTDDPPVSLGQAGKNTLYLLACDLDASPNAQTCPTETRAELKRLMDAVLAAPEAYFTVKDTTPNLSLSLFTGQKTVYTVTVTDQNGDPVEEAAVGFCTDVGCILRYTDKNGVATLTGEADRYHLSVVDAPDGYDWPDETDVYIGPEPGSATLTITKVFVQSSS